MDFRASFQILRYKTTMEKRLVNASDLFIAFHLKNTLNGSVEAAGLVKLAQEIFGSHGIETVDLDWSQDKEVIFRVSRPEGEEATVKFFQNLQELFKKTEDFHPHFTQIQV